MNNTFNTSTSILGNTQTSTPAFASSAVQTPGYASTPLNFGTALGSGGLIVNSVPTPARPVAAAPVAGVTPAPATPMAPMTPTPVKFTVPTPADNTYNSTQLSPGAYQDMANTYKAKYDALLTGKNPDGSPATGVASDSALSTLANKLYQTSLYTPAEQTLVQNQYDFANQISYDTLAAKRQIAALQESGAITKEQAAPMIQDVQDRANARLADLNYNNSQNTAQLSALGAIRQNQVTALQGQIDLNKPTSVAPGSTLVDPLTGQQLFQGSGAAPAQIATQAQQLITNDIASGTVQRDSSGQVDNAFYYQKAQQLLSGQATGNYGSASSPGTSGTVGSSSAGTQNTQYAPGFSVNTDGSITSTRGYSINAQDAKKVAALPQQFQNYTQGGPLGVAYIDASMVPSPQQTAVQQYASAQGIPYLSATEVSGVQAVDSIFKALTGMNTLANSVLSSGITGRLQGLTLNQALGYFQAGTKVTDPISGQQVPFGTLVNEFNQYRDTAGKAVTALAGGTGSGFRMNVPVIDAAVSNLPTSKDNLENAQIKTSSFAQLVLNQFATTFPSIATQNPLVQQIQTQNQAKTGGGNVIQTPVGAVDNSWFK